MKIFSFLFGKQKPKATAKVQQPRSNEQSSSPSTEEDMFQNAIKTYRQSQPKYEPDSLSFPEFNKEKLRTAYDLLSRCVEVEPNNIDALLMKAQCALDFYDKQLMALAMEDVNKVLQMNPKNPRAYDIRGSLSYALNEDREKAVSLAIENGKKVLELNPQYSSDFGLKISTRGTTNEAFRSNLKGLEKELEALRLKQQLQKESQLATQPKESSPLPRFKEITTKSPDEATTALCKGAFQSVPAINETLVRKRYLDVSSSWDSEQLFEGSIEEVTSVVLKNLKRLSVQPGFQNFQIKVYAEDECAQISAVFLRGGYTFQPIRLWRSTNKVFVCGNAAFKP